MAVIPTSTLPRADLSREELQVLLRRELARAEPERFAWLNFLQPYLVLLATAAVSGYLAPNIARRWQDRQKEFETKTRLVSEISRNVSQFVTAIQFYERGAEDEIPGQYNQIYFEWEVQSARISSELASYYGGAGLSGDFDRFASLVSNVYALSGTWAPEHREPLLERIQRELPAGAFPAQPLRSGAPEQRGTMAYQQAWGALRDAIYRRKDELVQRLLTEPMPAFHQ